MSNLRTCCFGECRRAAEFSVHALVDGVEIREGETESCRHHVGEMLGWPEWSKAEATCWSVYPIPGGAPQKDCETCAECGRTGVRIYCISPVSQHEPKNDSCNKCCAKIGEDRRFWIPLLRFRNGAVADFQKHAHTEELYAAWKLLPEAEPRMAPVWLKSDEWSI